MPIQAVPQVHKYLIERDSSQLELIKVLRTVSLTYQGSIRRVGREIVQKNAPMFRLYQRRLGLH